MKRLTRPNPLRPQRPFWLLGITLILAACGSAAAPPQTSPPPIPTPSPTPSPTTAPGDGPVISLWLTTPDQARRLERQADLRFSSSETATGVTVDVDEATTYQEMDGFGAALTDSSAAVIAGSLPAAARDELLARLFDRERGIGLSFLRLPMGASDFARTHYTYDDPPGGAADPSLTFFSIEHDRAEILPLLRQARVLQPSLRVMASPWSAPAWMKTSGSLYGGRLRPEYAGVYATYFVRFLEAYAAESVPVDFLSVQNEPHHEPNNYPGMRMEAADQVTFIRDHLGPALAARRLTPRLLVWDHNWDEPDYPIAVLNDPGAKALVAGSAFHCYAGDSSAQERVAAAHPDRGIWFTECSGGDWAPDYASNLSWNARTLVIGAIRRQARSIVLWNLALDQNRGPHLGGCSNCRGVVTVNTTTGNVTYEVEYDVLGHLSKVVVPGARRIASTQVEGRIETVAFKNADGTRVLVAFNAGSASETVSVRWSSQIVRLTLPRGALVSLRW